MLKQRHENLRLNRIFNFFASVVLLIFVLFVIGLVEMRTSITHHVGEGPVTHQKNPLEVGWNSVWRIEPASAATPAYAADIISAPSEQIKLQSGETATLKLLLKNVGTYRWRRSGQYMVTLNVVGTAKGTSPIFNQSWYKIRQPARIAEELVEPKETGSFEFIISAPSTPGTYKETFEAITKNKKILRGSRFSIVLTVVQKTDVLSAPSAGQFSEKLKTIPSDEPSIRVGLFTINPNDVTRASYESDYDLVRANGELVKTIPGGTVTALRYNPAVGHYLAEAGGSTFEEPEPIRLIPTNITDIVTIASAAQLHQWSPNVIDNRFRGIIEINFSSAKNTVWIINQLPLESYLKGLWVAADTAPGEFLKSIMVAARSYALFHYLNPYKHAAENFTVDAVIDQAYRGVNQELRTPHITQAIHETDGLVVTYNNEVVITPYFAQSDGRTRSWSEVWGGKDRPWLISVSAPSDAGKLLRGHGVGMSANDGISRAQAGNNFQDILKYFYQGTAIKKLY